MTDPNYLELLIRVRVEAPEPVIPRVDIAVKVGEARVLGIGFIKRGDIEAAWTRFRERADLWTPALTPYDFLYFDVVDGSEVAEAARRGDGGRDAMEYARHGGRMPTEFER